MKKTLLITMIFALLAFGLLARPRSYTQVLRGPGNTLFPDVTNSATQPSAADYVLRAWNTARPAEVLSTATHISGVIRVFRFGAGTDAVPYETCAFLQFSNFPTDWTAGETVHFELTKISTGLTVTWDLIIPDNGTYAIGHRQTVNPIPFVDCASIFSVPEPEYNLALSSNYPGAAIFKGGVDTGFMTPHTFTGVTDAIAGTYSVELANVNWTNSPYIYAGTADANHRFLGTVTPGNAVNPTPANGSTIDIAWDAIPVAYTLSWEAPAGPAPTSYGIWWQGNFMGAQDLLSWVTPLIAEGTYTWKVVPMLADPAKGLDRSAGPVKAKLVAPDSKADGVGVDWTFTIVRGEAPPEYDYEEGTENPYTQGDVTITIVIGGGNANNVPGAPPAPPTPNAAFVPVLTMNLEMIGMGPWTITIATTAPWGAWYSHTSNQWFAVQNVGGFITFVIPIGGKDIPIVPIVLGGSDPTLPVELSYFAATLTAQNFVKLTWVSQSETEMLGYRVYRGKNDEQASAIMITPSMIAATNTSTTQTYTLEDKEVEIGVTYWYWLESVDYGTSHFHGPASINVQGEVPPVLPEVTTMKNAYPNPFKTNKSTTIEVGIKAGETGTVTVYNILGQAVKTFKVTEGTHKLTWNGKDAKGNVCGSGIYFYKLSTPSVNQTKKMVIVK